MPAPLPRFAGLPKYNFIGGHNDPSLTPIEGLIEATASVLRREGQARDVQPGQRPQGYRGAARLCRTSSAAWPVSPRADDVLITSGSGQAIDLINSCCSNPATR